MVNKVILIGNVGADPEVHVFESGSKIVRIRVATTERIYNPATSQWTDHTEWHNVIVPQRQANFAETYIRKGSQVYIEGRLRRREWGEGDARRSAIEIRSDEIRLLGRRSEQSDFQSTTARSTNPTDQYATAAPVNEQPTHQTQPQSAASSVENPYMSTNSSYEAPSSDASDDLPF